MTDEDARRMCNEVVRIATDAANLFYSDKREEALLSVDLDRTPGLRLQRRIATMEGEREFTISISVVEHPFMGEPGVVWIVDKVLRKEKSE